MNVICHMMSVSCHILRGRFHQTKPWRSNHIDKVLDQGVSKPSHSPYALPTGLLCNAYRLLKAKNTQRLLSPSTHRRSTGIHGKVSNTSASTTSWSSARHLRNTNTCTTSLPPSRGTLVQRRSHVISTLATSYRQE